VPTFCTNGEGNTSRGVDRESLLRPRVVRDNRDENGNDTADESPEKTAGYSRISDQG